MDAVRRYLEQLGWSTPMVDVYLSLVDEGGVTPPEISKRLGRSPSWLHPALSRLKSEGALVYSKGGAKGKADLVDAQNPNILFDGIMTRAEKLKTEALAQIEESWERRRLAAPMPQDVAVHGGVGIHAAILSSIEGASRRIVVLDPQLSWVNPTSLTMLGKKKSTVTVRVLTDGDSKAQKLQLGVKGIDLRVQEKFPMEFVICDDKVIVFQTGSASATISNNPSMADFLCGQFDGWFGKAKRGDKT